MSTEANKALIRGFLAEVWDRGNVAALDNYFGPTYRRHGGRGTPPLDLAGQRKRLLGIRAAFPDVTITLEDLVAEGDRVVLRGTLRGTHQGPFLSVPPTGKRVEVALLDVMRIEDGRVVEHWGGPDFLDWLGQLGAVMSVPA